MVEFLGAAYLLAKETFECYKSFKEVADAAKGAYDAAKGIKEHFELHETEAKLVDFSWPEKSGFQAEAKLQGFEIAWSRPDLVASRELDGYQVMYEVELPAKTKRKLVLRDGMVLIGREVRA